MEENKQDSEQDPAFQALVSDLKEIGSGLQQMLQNALPVVDGQIDHITHTQSRDLRQIEFLLDSLTDWLMWGVGGEQYIRLVEHLKTFDPELAAHYWQRYDQPDPYADLDDPETDQ
jgi:hypothetical protein